jgi:AsmA protein
MKLVLKIIGAVFVVIVVAIAALVITFDPNDYKDTITAQVEKQTGRAFEIAGDIRLSVFPWIGVMVEDVSLANAAGFSEQPFARMSQLDVKVMLLPLLRKELQVDKVRLHGLFASLEVDKQGNNNWSDLAQQEQPAPQQPQATEVGEPSAPALAALAINGVELIDATVVWTDLQNDVHSQLSGFSLTTGAIRFNEPVDIELNTKVKHNEPSLDALISLTTRLTFNEAFTNLLLDALQLKVAANAPELLPEQLDLLLQSNINIDVDQELAALNDTRISALDTTLHANLNINELLTEPVVDGNMYTDDINARELMKRLGIELPPMAGKDSLTKVAYASTIKANASFVELNAIKVTLDDSDITGWFHVPDLAQPVVRYKLHVSPIDVDAYLPPQTDTAEAAPSDADVAVDSAAVPEEDVEIELPVELLRTLDMQGELTMETVTANQIPLNEILVKTQAKGGLLRVDPLQLKALDGSANGSVMVNAKTDTPSYSIGLKASNIRPGPVVDPMLVGIFGGQKVTLDGAANMLVNIDTKGSRVSELKQAAKGKLTFDMAKTLLEGVDFEHYVRNVVADYLAGRGLPVPAEWRGSFDPQTKTAFTRAHASATIANGDITNPDLILDSSRIKVKGQGVANIIRNDMDYNALIDIEPSRRQTTAEKLLDQPLAVRIHGPFEQLAYDVDESRLKKALGDLLEAEAKAKVQKEIDEEKAKLEQKVEEKEKELKQELEDKLKDRLKGLF